MTPMNSRSNPKSSNPSYVEQKVWILRGGEGDEDLPEDIAPLALTWRRETSREEAWRVDTQVLPKQLKIEEMAW